MNFLSNSLDLLVGISDHLSYVSISSGGELDNYTPYLYLGFGFYLTALDNGTAFRLEHKRDGMGIYFKSRGYDTRELEPKFIAQLIESAIDPFLDYIAASEDMDRD
jgi:hypothetical protein